MRLSVSVACLLLPGLLPLQSSVADDAVVGPTGTTPLTLKGDIASEMVDGIDRFLLRKIADSPAGRPQYWNRDASSAASWNASIQPNRERLAHILGLRDKRIAFDAPELISTVTQSAVLAENERYRILSVRWPVLLDPAPTGKNLPSIFGEGLLLDPKPQAAIGVDIVAIPDADQSPEQICGLVPGLPQDAQFARHLADAGCRVMVPMLISRERTKRNGRATLTSREYAYRSAFELGRHIIGYELQKVLSAVDWFDSEADDASARIGVIGYGEGGMLALYAGALDPRINSTVVSGFFGPREQSWQEPLDRNVFGLLREFGAAELAAMVSPRTLIIEAAHVPQVDYPGEGGAPASLTSPTIAELHASLAPATKATMDLLTSGIQKRPVTVLVPSDGAMGGILTLDQFLQSIIDPDGPQNKASIPQPGRYLRRQPTPLTEIESTQSIADRQIRQLQEIDRHNQALLRESSFVRNDYMKRRDLSSVEAYEKSIEQYRDEFRRDVIGEFDEELLPFRALSRKSWDTEKWTGHEVVLEVFPDVFAYGVLLLPKDLQPNQRRPVVVCQHGLEGRPTDIFQGDHRAYHDFAARLCERGFVTFSPQNPYIFQDRFRTLQRKANPLGKTLFSIIVPQHQQIVNWLKSQPFVDSDRIAFYGLSYGGKSAMRIPALVTDYCLSICSADFNEWVRKNASTRDNFSYVWTGEYEIFEWDLGSTFNYAEMAGLICPRPFMVERGHFDGVGDDEWVGYEFAKVRHLYAARLGIGDRTHIEWFVGPHTINGQDTYRFLHKHLDWPEP